MDEFEEAVCSGFGQRTGGLVQDQQSRLRGDRSHDLDPLLQFNAEIAYPNIDTDVYPEGIEFLTSATPHLPPVDSAPTSPRQPSHQDVLSHRQLWRQGQFLADHNYAQGTRCNGIRDLSLDAIDYDRAPIRLLDTTDNLGQCRLARPVLPGQ
ncbi:hypothetical protein R4282_03585 [Rhodococcus oxybenzonivorans]|nr:hypothetical protein [Rhodococcus oxybenzonivorans]MDV7352101.1 hypothetical protein [Rhodococcus oxybenzonivorans]